MATDEVTSRFAMATDRGQSITSAGLLGRHRRLTRLSWAAGEDGGTCKGGCGRGGGGGGGSTRIIL